MIDVYFDGPHARRLLKELESISENIDRELSAVSGKAGTKGVSLIAKAVSERVAIKQKDVRKDIKKTRIRPYGVRLVLNKTDRISLKRFSPRMTRAGVTYKIDKKGGRKTVIGGFTGPRPGLTSVRLRGHVFRRKNLADSKSQIVKRRGPSAAGVLTPYPARVREVSRQVQREFRTQIVKRIKYRRLKLSGTI